MFATVYYQEDLSDQAPSYRHLLVQGNNLPGGAAVFLHLDPEHATKCDAQIEARDSGPLLIYGMKAEGNMAPLWVRNASKVLVTGWGGLACALPGNASYPPGVVQDPPSLIRLEGCDEPGRSCELFGLMDYGASCGKFDGFTEFPPTLWTFVAEKNSLGRWNATVPLTRPVMYSSGS